MPLQHDLMYAVRHFRLQKDRNLGASTDKSNFDSPNEYKALSTISTNWDCNGKQFARSFMTLYPLIPGFIDLSSSS